MAVISWLNDYLSQSILVILTLITLLYLYSIHRFNYWKNKGITYIPGTLPFGSLGSLIFQKIGFVEHFLNIYRYNDEKYVGFYAFFTPQLLIKDLDLVKDVLVKNFNIFTDRGVYHNKEVDAISANLFALEGNYWKNLRGKLGPTFTSGKLKSMHETMRESAQELQNYGINLKKKTDIFDVKDLACRYGLDVIASVTLGLQSNNFQEDNSEMKRIVALFSTSSTSQMMRTTFVMMFKKLARFLRFRFVSKEVEDYFLGLVTDVTVYRERNNIRRKDLMQSLIDLKNKAPDSENQNEIENPLTFREMAAQSFVFVAAGFDSSAVTLGFSLYELALNTQIQDRLIEELDAAGENPSYETLHQLPYLEMVVNETLRKYPALPNLQRECSQDYTLPGGQVLEKGTLIQISVIGLHHDPKLYPNPEEFDPERFSKENIHKIKPYSYLPFGEGPRICIGWKFAKVQVKAAMASFLSRFRVEVCEKTPIPIKIEKKTFLYNVEGGMWLRVIDRKQYV